MKRLNPQRLLYVSIVREFRTNLNESLFSFPILNAFFPLIEENSYFLRFFFPNGINLINTLSRWSDAMNHIRKCKGNIFFNRKEKKRSQNELVCGACKSKANGKRSVRYWREQFKITGKLKMKMQNVFREKIYEKSTSFFVGVEMILGMQ